MKVFQEQTNQLKVGQEVEDFLVSDNLLLSDLRGSPIFLVLWKTL